MKVTEHLHKANNTLISFEILPPLKGKSIDSLFSVLDKLTEYNPPFINVTYHRAEYKYKALENGLFEKVYTRKRPGTVGICAAIINKYPNIDAVPHIICGGFTKNDTEDALLDLNYLGVNNVLLLRGDPIKTERTFAPENKGNSNAIELVKQVVNLNQGIYLEEDLKNALRTNFCIGVAGYPEKHYEAPNLTADIEALKLKVEAGADYVITQMFFDNQKYFDYVHLCRKAGIEVPIIAGIKPISTKEQIFKLPSSFYINMPNDLVNAVLKCNNNDDVKQVGIEWAIAQCNELKKQGVPCLHFYTMGVVDNIQQIIKGIL